MRKEKIELFLTESIGKIKKINGGNLAPPIANEKAGRNIRSTYHDMNLALTRLPGPKHLLQNHVGMTV